jgi:hypothetical protein
MLTCVHEERATQSLEEDEPGGEYESADGQEFKHSPSGAKPVWEYEPGLHGRGAPL